MLSLGIPIFSATKYMIDGFKYKKISSIKTISFTIFLLLQSILIFSLPLTYVQMGQKLFILLISISLAFSLLIMFSEYL